LVALLIFNNNFESSSSEREGERERKRERERERERENLLKLVYKLSQAGLIGAFYGSNLLTILK
jgi:hypothetical protein